MSTNSRILSYGLAINEALHQTMTADEAVFLLGQGVKSPWYVGQTAQGLLDTFGSQRVIDTPVSENAVTGAAVGAALVGMRPIVVHPRMDFMMYAMDPILNEAANWHYMNGGAAAVPVVFWGIINRGGEQAAQHSQALHAMFAHFPGLKVAMPATPYDAKGLMVASIREDNPVVFIDDRWLHGTRAHVPEKIYTVELGKAAIRREGADVTLVAVSYLVPHAEKAATTLSDDGIQVEVIDIRTVKPIDKECILRSVSKTGRLVIADVGWKSFGMAAEISAIVAGEGFDTLRSPITRVCLPDSPAPASSCLEKAFYPDSDSIITSIRNLMR